MPGMDVGLNLQTLPRERIAKQVSAIAAGAETVGLHSAWGSEHIVLPAQVEPLDPYSEEGVLPFEIDTLYPEAMVLLGHLAARPSQGLAADLDAAVPLREGGADFLITHAETESDEILPKLEKLASTVLPEP